MPRKSSYIFYHCRVQQQETQKCEKRRAEERRRELEREKKQPSNNAEPIWCGRVRAQRTSERENERE